MAAAEVEGMTPAHHERILQTASWSAVGFLVCFVMAVLMNVWEWVKLT